MNRRGRKPALLLVSDGVGLRGSLGFFQGLVTVTDADMARPRIVVKVFDQRKAAAMLGDPVVPTAPVAGVRSCPGQRFGVAGNVGNDGPKIVGETAQDVVDGVLNLLVGKPVLSHGPESTQKRVDMSTLNGGCL